MKNKIIRSILALTALALIIIAGLSQQILPAVKGLESKSENFSAVRARKDLDWLASAPHPVGSPQNSIVLQRLQERLTGLGLTPSIEEYPVVFKKWNIFAHVKNCIVILKGKNPDRKALLISGHYDSVAAGPGASDDGIAVVSMLETIRALKQKPQLDNDIIFLFSDGEEMGLIGAEGFMQHSKLADRVGMAMNFEARGTSGPSILFETGITNGRSIKLFAGKIRPVFSSSFSVEVYKRMPNNTDFTCYKVRGIPGLNFACIGDFQRYHQPNDSPENISLATLQQHGENMMAGIEAFGNENLDQPETGNSVFFTIFGALIHYSYGWIMPLFILALALFGASLFFMIRKGKITLSDFFRASGLVLFYSLILSALGMVIWKILSASLPALSLPVLLMAVLPYHYNLITAFIILILGIVIGLIPFLHRKTSLPAWLTGCAALFTLLSLITSLFLPGASYLFTIPAIFLNAGVFLLLLPAETTPQFILSLGLRTLICLIASMILLPLVSLVTLALGMDLSGAILFIFLCGIIPCLLFAQELENIPGIVRISALGLSAAVMLILIIATSAFTEAKPEQSFILYGTEPQTQKAFWYKPMNTYNSWYTNFGFSQKGGDSVKHNFFYWGRDFYTRINKAPYQPLNLMKLEVLKSETQDKVRHWKLKLSFTPKNWGYILVKEKKTAPEECLFLADGLPLKLSADYLSTINPLPNKEITIDIYQPLPAGISLEMEAYDFIRPDIPGFHFPERPKNLMKSFEAVSETQTIELK